jgi:ubiquinone/menaquinone biosynthesis C-methylase UbiE
MEKYDKIGLNYNVTRRADPYLTSKFIWYLTSSPDKVYLDIGCGTGNYTTKLQKAGYKFIGIDPSAEMLNKAKSKGPKVDWIIGTAENTSLQSSTIDGILGSLTIHHWPDLVNAFSELSRILKPNGTIVLFTSTPDQMKGYWLNHYFPTMLENSINQMPSFDIVKSAMEGAGFSIINTEPYSIMPDLEDLFLYCGKHNPNLYFQPEVRAGISSFASLANAQEVKEGLQKLKVDLDSGQINEVMKTYANDRGDYLFVIGEKN